MKNQNNYFFEIIFLPIVIIIFLVISITTYNIQITKKQLNSQITNKKIEYLENQKKTIYNKVQFINSSIKIENSKIETKLKEKLREKIQNAISISDDVYKENRKLPEDLIKSILVRRLSFLNYNKNRGYYFIIDKDNRFINHPIKEFNKKDMSSFVDKENNNIIHELRQSTKNKDISFAKYYFVKPNDTEKEYLKLTAITYYKPLDVLIGTGEYLDVLMSELKNDFINKLKQNKDLNNYIFILDMYNLNGGEKFSKLLVNNNRTDLVDKYLNDNETDSKGVFYRKEYLKVLREKGEGFVSYWYKKPDTQDNKQKLTYFYLNKEWNWVIGSGFYLEDLENHIQILKKESDNYLRELISNSIFWGIIFSFVTILISLMIFYRIQKRIAEDREKLILSEENLKKAQQVANMGSWGYYIDSKEITWSDEIFEILELDKEKYMPSYELFLSCVLKDDKNRVRNVFSNTLKNKNSHDFTHRIKTKNSIKWVNNQCEIFYDKKINRYLMIGTLQDITEKYEKDKKIEEQSQLLFNQSKMAAMGEMIENIAHQWRQPLSAISISASALKLENEYGMSDSKKLDKGLGDILNNTTYLSNTIEDFRSYFVQDKKKSICKLKEVYNSCIKLLKPKFISADIFIIENFEDIECETLKNELVQCLMNILNNAYDALLKNEKAKKLIFINIYKEYDNAVISIKDNAGGIDKKIIDKVFEPYFTTKHQSQGTGIGLYMTQEIITRHLNGYIKVSNKEFDYNGIDYVGACFKISIPLSGDLIKAEK